MDKATNDEISVIEDLYLKMKADTQYTTIQYRLLLNSKTEFEILWRF